MNTPEQRAEAERRWPRDVPDETHIRQIMRDTGLPRADAAMCLAIERGDSEGDVIEVDDDYVPG